MDFKGYYKNFKCLVLFVLCASLFDCQRITCPTPCDIGFTCAMVRQGNSGIAPGCISMEEAILLHQALNGGPSGPGTGITSSVGQQPSIPQVSGITPIPGMNFHGSTVPEPRGFEQRFQQGLNQVPTSLFSPPNRPRQNGIGIAGPSLFGTGLPNTQRPIGFSNSGFLDPLSGQLPGPSVGGIPGQGFGIGQRIDGGDSFSRHAGASQTNSLGNTNRQPNLDSGGGGGGRITSPRNGGFPECRRGNTWCPQGYICMNVRTASGNYEDRCVLPRTRRLPPFYRTRVIGLSPKQLGRSVSHLTVIPMVNQNKQSQSAIMVDVIQPDLVKQERFQIQQLKRNSTMEAKNVTVHNNGLYQSRTAIPSTISSFQTTSAPYVVVRSITTASTSHTCVPCNDHVDCNDLFTYCINKVPCSGKVCHRVT